MGRAAGGHHAGVHPEVSVEGDSAAFTLPVTLDPPANLFPVAAAGSPARPVSGPAAEVQGRGYGASMFFNWLTRKCGGSLVWKTFDQYRYRAPGVFMEPRYSAAEALAAAVLDCKTARDLNSEWPEFCERIWGGPL